MEIMHAVILGIVEGITEFLPISSTGHLILATHLLGIDHNNFVKSFEIAIQLGAILSVVVLYWKKFLLNFEILKRVAAAFIPTAILGFILYKLIKQFLLGNVQLVVWMLFLGGILLIVFEYFHKQRQESVKALDEISYSKAILIGVFQSIAMIPGVSRSAATILGGLLLGVERKTIVEFSFLLAVPTMAAATILDLLKNAQEFSSVNIKILLIGSAVSFFVAILSIKFLLKFIQNHTFVSFGIYRIILAILFWMCVR